MTRLVCLCAAPVLGLATVACAAKSVRSGRVQGTWWRAAAWTGALGAGCAWGAVSPTLGALAALVVVARVCRE